MKPITYTPITEITAGSATSTELFEQLSAAPEGLSDNDAQLRTAKYGKNIVSQKSVQPLIVLLRHVCFRVYDIATS